MGSFPGRKLARCFSQNEIAIWPRENAFPGPAVALDGPGSMVDVICCIVISRAVVASQMMRGQAPKYFFLEPPLELNNKIPNKKQHRPSSLQISTVFTVRCTIVQSAVLLSHVVCPSFCLSVCDVGKQRKSYYGGPIGSHQRSFEWYHPRLPTTSSPRLGLTTANQNSYNGALRGHLCDSTAFLSIWTFVEYYLLN